MTPKNFETFSGERGGERGEWLVEEWDNQHPTPNQPTDFVHSLLRQILSESSMPPAQTRSAMARTMNGVNGVN